MTWFFVHNKGKKYWFALVEAETSVEAKVEGKRLSGTKVGIDELQADPITSGGQKLFISGRIGG